MAGSPAKCLDCGRILADEGSRNMCFCPECEARKAETSTLPTVEELKKAA